MSFTTTIDPATPPQHGVKVLLPFQINGLGTVQAITVIDGGFRTCTCLGTAEACYPSCSTSGLHAAVATVCQIPQLVPGQWQFTIYCTGSNVACETPLTRALHATTTVTYTPSGN